MIKLMKDCLLKFGKVKSYLVDFVQKGHVYLNPISFFYDCEKNDNGQLDIHESVDLYSHGEGAKISISGRSFDIAAPFGLRTGEGKWSHIFCSYLLTNESIEREKRTVTYSDRLWDEFGDYIVLIHDAQSFCSMLADALSRQRISFKSEKNRIF